MGPTSSGKSALGIAIAQTRPAVIINADAMQLVHDLRVLTARPTVEEEAQAEHALYGVLDARAPTSVAVWLGLVQPVIERAWAEGKLPVLLGGTGMYIKALKDGLAAVPTVSEEIRAAFRAMPQEALHPLLLEKDPLMAARLKAGDTQRLLRALEVMEATGESLAHWQQRTTAPLFPQATYQNYYVDIAREELYARIDRRFDIMMANGALDEVRALVAKELPADLPILRAHGVPELALYLKGEMTLADAVAKGQQNTRNYAKRQMTWIRNQMADATAIRGGQLPDLN